MKPCTHTVCRYMSLATLWIIICPSAIIHNYVIIIETNHLKSAMVIGLCTEWQVQHPYIPDITYTRIYGTAQRQLDTHTCAAAWNFSCEDYIMHSICTHQANRRAYVPATFHSFWINFVVKLNINFICTMILRTLSLYVPINPWINSLPEKLLMCSCMQYCIPYFLVCYRLCGKWILYWRLNLH